MMDDAPPAVVIGARRLVAEVWRLVENQRIDARSPAADAALDLRDLIDPSWWPVAEEEREACGVTGSRTHNAASSEGPNSTTQGQ